MPHLVFVGNPGTGKTTVARLLGRLYHAIGLLPTSEVIEVDRTGLVAGYVGQTALKTRDICMEALGGVLFIDEAYSLARDDGGFGQEAIDTLLSMMEMHRGEFAVIVAGYPQPMAEFVFSNPGLNSRFDDAVVFDDYSPEELMNILIGMVAARDYELTPAALEKVAAFIESWPRNPGFGNAREVRNLVNAIVRKHASLLAEAAVGSPAETEAVDAEHIATEVEATDLAAGTLDAPEAEQPGAADAGETTGAPDTGEAATESDTVAAPVVTDALRVIDANAVPAVPVHRHSGGEPGHHPG